MGVTFDDSEVEGTPATSADDNEMAKHPGGIVGFQLNFFQVAC